MNTPIEMQAFFANRASSWEDFVKKEWLPDDYEHYYTLLASKIPVTNEPIKILDLGCGGGIEFEWILQRAPNAHITGVDQSKPMLDCLREKYAERLHQFNLLQGNYLTCPLPKEAFDYAVTSMSVHYFQPAKRREIYERIHHTLKNGSIYIEGTYCSDSEEEEQTKLSDFKRKTEGLDGANSGRFKINLPLRAETIVQLLNQAGFSKIEWLEGWVVVAQKEH